MFTKLNGDDSNTLDLRQIAGLFKTNGINMTVDQVADMFGEAFRQ